MAILSDMRPVGNVKRSDYREDTAGLGTWVTQ